MLGGPRRALLDNYSNEGYLSREEAEALLNLVDELKTDLPIVEIGVFAAMTTALLAEYLQMNGRENKVIGVDVCKYVSNEKVLDRIKDYPNAKLIVGDSRDKAVIDQVKDISLLFMDGGHYLDDVDKDITNWLPKVKEIVVFHDAYSNHHEHEVMKAIDKHKLKVEKSAGSIAVLRCSAS
ncbi:MAG: class I SAM-dependent methyltransferase [Blastocatellia bacterium]|nr:class I SAM-dependent methyltransferase [Blastocatellia bacterium]